MGEILLLKKIDKIFKEELDLQNNKLSKVSSKFHRIKTSRKRRIHKIKEMMYS